MKTKLFAIVLAFLSGCRLCPATEIIFGEENYIALPFGAETTSNFFFYCTNCYSDKANVIFIQCQNIKATSNFELAVKNKAYILTPKEFQQRYQILCELDLILKSISEIESGNNDFAKGKRGEVSRYQLKRSVWKAYTPLSFSMATNPQTTYQVASCVILDRENAFLKRNGRRPTAFEIYLLWHCPARINKPTKQDAEIAQRFANLCEKITNKENKK